MAKADGVDSFTYQSNGNTFVWQLPSSPIPGSSNVSPGLSFTLNNVSVSENGAASVLATFDFFTLLDGGRFDLTIEKAIPINAFGLAVFNGSLNSPTFLTGKFLLLDFGTSETVLWANSQSPMRQNPLRSDCWLGAVATENKNVNAQKTDKFPHCEAPIITPVNMVLICSARYSLNKHTANNISSASGAVCELI